MLRPNTTEKGLEFEDQHPQQHYQSPLVTCCPAAENSLHLEAHVERLPLAGLRGHEASIDAVVVPGIVATGEVCDDRRKIDCLLQAIAYALAQNSDWHYLERMVGGGEVGNVRHGRAEVH